MACLTIGTSKFKSRIVEPDASLQNKAGTATFMATKIETSRRQSGNSKISALLASALRGALLLIVNHKRWFILLVVACSSSASLRQIEGLHERRISGSS